MENVEIRIIDDQEVEVFITDLPFLITRGKKGFYYIDNYGNEKPYNIFLEEGLKDERWFAELDKSKPMPLFLEDIFKPKPGRSLETIVRYCVNCYLRALDAWRVKIRKENSQWILHKRKTKYRKAKRMKIDKLKFRD